MTELTITVEGPCFGVESDCDRILRSLPEWFGIESAIVHYVGCIEKMPSFVARTGSQIIGFLTIARHFAESAEIYVMGIAPEHHRRGVGQQLISAAEDWLRAEGVMVLQVKTVSASRENAAYEKTRAFYSGVGFIPIEEFPTLWSEENPCLQMAKTL